MTDTVTRVRAAVDAGDPDALGTLLAAQPEALGEALAAQRLNGWVVLDLALRHTRADLVAACLGAGIEPDIRGPLGQPPLHVAIERNDIDSARLLIEAGADLQAPCRSGLAALHRAVRSRSMPLVELLLARGARDAPHARFGSALHDGLMHAPLEIARRLIAAPGQVDVNGRDDDGRSALHGAAMCALPEMIAPLIAAGAEIDARDGNGLTPLLLGAESSDCPDTLNALLDGGADLEARTPFDETPLLTACAAAQGRAALALLEAGADPNAAAITGTTALQEAVRLGPRYLVDALLRAGARPNTLDEAGNTPVHEAARLGSMDLVGCLLAAGADPSLHGDQAPCAAEVAAEHGHPELAEHLRSRARAFRLHMAKNDGPGEPGPSL